MLPIIDSVQVAPGTVAPGGLFTVTVVARDPDTKSYTLTGNAIDSQGGKTAFSGQVNVSDPLTFELTDASGAGFVITPRAAQPGVFDCKAP